MEREYGRDPGLSFRMALALVLLALFYLPLAAWLAGFAFLLTTSVALAGLAVLGTYAVAVLVPALSEPVALALVRARPVSDGEAPHLEALVQRVAAMAELPPPRIAISPLQAPNAFTVGRSPRSAVVVVTRGLIDRLDERELEAVVAHEVAHIVHRDVFVMMLAGAPALLLRRILWAAGRMPARAGNPLAALGAVVALLYLLPLLFVGWLVLAFAVLLVMTLSRYREYAADRTAALLIGGPAQLMSALQRVAGELEQIPQQDLRDTATLNAFAIVAAGYAPETFEVDPLRLFPTHPPLARRLDRLSALERSIGRARGLGETPGAPTPAPAEGRPRAANAYAVAAFVIAVGVWALLAWTLLAAPNASVNAVAAVSLLGSAGMIGGILLALQGIGRASAGASGMGFAAAALALLLGPWALGFVALAGLAILIAVAGP